MPIPGFFIDIVTLGEDIGTETRGYCEGEVSLVATLEEALQEPLTNFHPLLKPF